MTSGVVTVATDFPVTRVVPVGDANELVECFASHRDGDPPLRICGRGSLQQELAAPALGASETAVQMISLAPMRRILRLEPDDLACSVEPGVMRAELDEALRERGLWLPCDDSDGTLGGLFATGRATPEAPGPLASLGVRATLLGLRGVLVEGKRFKAGARVVKSVAGFDVHKLFVGSRGRLFAATELHLKLRPLARCSAPFVVPSLDLDEAISRYDALRHDTAPPARLWLTRAGGAPSFTLQGRYDGASGVVLDRMRRHALDECAWSHDRSHETGRERLGGAVPPSRIAALLRAMPEDARLRISGTGRFETWLAAHSADILLAQLPTLGGSGELECGAPERRGRATPIDAGAARLEARLRDAFDPKGRLR